MSKKITRKQFLKCSCAALASSIVTDPFLTILDSIVKSQMRTAFGNDLARPRKWLDMRFDNAPPRFMYDLFLHNLAADRASTKFIQNPNYTYTKFQAINNRYTTGSYVTVEMKALGKSSREIWAPHLWTLNVPAVGGGTRPMSELLQNFLNVRAIDTGNPSHDGAAALHYLPLGASQSVTALSADGSSAPIAAVSYNAAYYKFRSITANSSFAINGADLAASLLSPFDPAFGSSLTVSRQRQSVVRDYLDAARAGLRADALVRHPDNVTVHKAISGARELMGSSVTALKAQWAPLLAKYQALVAAAIVMEIPGINDKPIGIAVADRKSGADGGGAYDIVGRPVLNPNVEDIITSNSYILRMAESFAVSEFILTNNLSDSITVSVGPLMNLSVLFPGAAAVAATATNFDEHQTGAMTSTLINSVHAVAHSACLLELIDKLKAAGMWAQTVINCSGEFNRIPRGNGVGSDHLYEGASLALYSGIIDGPHILGDIASNSHPQLYNGTSGVAVPQVGLATDNTRIDLGNAAATIAQLLGVRSPITAREPLVVVRGNTIFPRIPPGKIVA